MKEVRLLSLHTEHLNPQEIFLVTSSVRGRVVPRVIVRPEWLGQWKIPVSLSGIEPTTLRFVVQCLTQLRQRTDFLCHTREETQLFAETSNAIKIYKKLVNSSKIPFEVHNYGNFTFANVYRKQYIASVCLWASKRILPDPCTAYCKFIV